MRAAHADNMHLHDTDAHAKTALRAAGVLRDQSDEMTHARAKQLQLHMQSGLTVRISLLANASAETVASLDGDAEYRGDNSTSEEYSSVGSAVGAVRD